jgi:hypothetical protein
MKMTDEEKRLIESARRLESTRCREMLLLQAETMYLAQEAVKKDYGLMGPDAALFNQPQYADRNAAPMGTNPGPAA